MLCTTCYIITNIFDDQSFCRDSNTFCSALAFFVIPKIVIFGGLLLLKDVVVKHAHKHHPNQPSTISLPQL